MGTTTDSCAHAPILYAYLESERGLTTTPDVRERLASIMRTPAVRDEVHSEDDIHVLRLALDRIAARRQRGRIRSVG
jgi:hypothetical protein